MSEEVLIGKWRIGSVENEGLLIICNSCPQIEFQSGNVALLLMPNNETEKYFWSVSDKTLTLKNESQVGDKPYFGGPEYAMRFENKSDYLKLELTDKSGTIYYLGKTNNADDKKFEEE